MLLAADVNRSGLCAQAQPGLRTIYAGYGVGWLIVSIVTGLLYEQSRLALVIFAIATQLVSLPLFAVGAKSAKVTAS
jgi:biotin transporter BioY